MSESNTKCCDKHYPRMPYTHINTLVDMCSTQCSNHMTPAIITVDVLVDCAGSQLL